MKRELETPRLFLRAWQDSDREPFARMNADPRVMRWFPSPMTDAQTDGFMARLDDHHQRHGYTFWAVEVRASDRGPCSFAGFVGLTQPRYAMPFEHGQPLVEVGWRLSPDWWGMGIATEAANASLAFAFNELDLDEVVSYTVPANIASQAVMQRLGMSYSGTFNHPDAGLQWWAPHVLYRARRPAPTGVAEQARIGCQMPPHARQASLTGHAPRKVVSVTDAATGAVPRQSPNPDVPVERRR